METYITITLSCMDLLCLEAYRLESECANYPRIVVDAKCIEVGVENKLPHNPTKFERETYDGLLKKDGEDGLLYIDFLSQYEECDSLELYADLLLQTKKLIKKGLIENSAPRVLEKYNWFKKYYMTTLNSLTIEWRRDNDLYFKNF